MAHTNGTAYRLEAQNRPFVDIGATHATMLQNGSDREAGVWWAKIAGRSAAARLPCHNQIMPAIYILCSRKPAASSALFYV